MSRLDKLSSSLDDLSSNITDLHNILVFLVIGYIFLRLLHSITSLAISRSDAMQEFADRKSFKSKIIVYDLLESFASNLGTNIAYNKTLLTSSLS